MQMECREELFNRIPARMLVEQQIALAIPISRKELNEAAKAMARKKSPGPDGIAIEFFTHKWDTICGDFHQMILEAVESGSLPKAMNIGLIVLLFKRGERANVGNKRPITLLNTA